MKTQQNLDEKDIDLDIDNYKQSQQSNKKNGMIFTLLLAIIWVLLAGVVYQFVCIKKLENQIAEQSSASVMCIKNQSKEVVDKSINLYFNLF